MKHIEKLYEHGKSFEQRKTMKDRKAKGVFYTPLDIVEYMVNRAVADMDVISNPYVKIFDISCGAGYFLLKCFEALKNLFEQNYNAILAANPELKKSMPYDGISRFIVEHNIYGADIDAEAVELVRASLDKAAGCSCRSNIICADSLLGISETWSSSFDCVIGNPPYIGHKAVAADYKKQLHMRYGKVYRDKSDISYCFFQKGLELLKEKGILSFITSRYFLEGPSAAGLREYLAYYDILELVDFGDCRVFDDAGVSVCIAAIKKQSRRESIWVKKLDNADKSKNLNIAAVEAFEIQGSYLHKEGWLLLEPERLELFNKIEKHSTHAVEDIFDSYQGIITGCDKAFVLSRQQAAELGIEEALLKPWIKNSHIEKFNIKPTDKLLIYTDLIKSPEEYPKAVSFADAYKEKLQQRRECQKGVRHWYQLQWGRDSRVFESVKLVYPYKAGTNRFAVDRTGMYCSADVYSLVPKRDTAFSLDYLAALLNSKIMEFYFKSIAKKISPGFYDYYPNKVLKIKLKLDVINPEILSLVSSLHNNQNSEEIKCILQAIDRETYKMYDLNERQIEIIEQSAEE